MTEEQLIAKLKELRQIKPRENWVLLNKEEIFRRGRASTDFGFWGVLEGMRIILRHKYAFSSLVIALVLFGLFGFSQNSLPGDYLYSIRRIGERSQNVFVSEKDQSKHDLNIAGKRLDDLVKVAETKSARNLASAINEFQASISKAAESLAKTKDPKIVQEIALEIKKLEEKTEQVKSLGLEIGESEELENVLAEIVEREIKDLETRTLTEEQAEILIQAKSDFEAGNYSDALEKILLIN